MRPLCRSIGPCSIRVEPGALGGLERREAIDVELQEPTEPWAWTHDPGGIKPRAVLRRDLWLVPGGVTADPAGHACAVWLQPLLWVPRVPGDLDGERMLVEHWTDARGMLHLDGCHTHLGALPGGVVSTDWVDVDLSPWVPRGCTLAVLRVAADLTGSVAGRVEVRSVPCYGAPDAEGRLDDHPPGQFGGGITTENVQRGPFVDVRPGSAQARCTHPGDRMRLTVAAMLLS